MKRCIKLILKLKKLHKNYKVLATGGLSDIFTKHFHITTSGNFSDSALLCTIMEMGADRIIFSVDWPYVENKPGTDWLETISVSPEDKQKILNGNAKKLLRM